VPTPGQAGSAELFTIDGLTPETHYFFALKSADEKPNWSDLSNIAAESTLAEGVGYWSTLGAGMNSGVNTLTTYNAELAEAGAFTMSAARKCII